MDQKSTIVLRNLKVKLYISLHQSKFNSEFTPEKCWLEDDLTTWESI